jgi:hypothetical protein
VNRLRKVTEQAVKKDEALVWGVPYWNGTGNVVDISDPNNMTIEGFSVLGAATILRRKLARDTVSLSIHFRYYRTQYKFSRNPFRRPHNH